MKNQKKLKKKLNNYLQKEINLPYRKVDNYIQKEINPPNRIEFHRNSPLEECLLLKNKQSKEIYNLFKKIEEL